MVERGNYVKIIRILKDKEYYNSIGIYEEEFYPITDVTNDRIEFCGVWCWRKNDPYFEYNVIKGGNYDCSKDFEIAYEDCENENYKVDKHKAICEKLNEIYSDKNHDYGDSFGDTYKKLGIISAVTRITDKVNRLQSLCTKEQKVKGESIEDTLMDLANYAIMTLIELKEGEKQ